MWVPPPLLPQRLAVNDEDSSNVKIYEVKDLVTGRTPTPSAQRKAGYNAAHCTLTDQNIFCGTIAQRSHLTA